MSVQQDRLTFFGVLIAVVVAVVGYLQLGSHYPATGHAQPGAETGAVEVDLSNQETIHTSDHETDREDHVP